MMFASIKSRQLRYLTCIAALQIISSNGVLANDDQLLTARGLVRSDARTELRTDLMAMVTHAEYREGMTFNKGDTLVAFDCRKHQAELNSARAAAKGTTIAMRNKVVLRRNGAAGKSEVSLARAENQKALHDVKALSARMNYCSIAAPFSGRVVELNVHKLEMPSTSKPLMVIINDNSLELELVVPSMWLAWMKTGIEFKFSIDETQKDYSASVQRLGAEVDPVSQTIKVYARLDGNLQNVLAGMSGAAVFAGAGL